MSENLGGFLTYTVVRVIVVVVVVVVVEIVYEYN